MKKPCIILTGPTAVGKTSLSIAIAKKFNCEIISADSMQVYQNMDIGSAKISKEEMDGIPHYLIDALSPKENFDVAKFQMMAKEAMEKIYQKGKIPLIVGGTGFYIQALLYDIDFSQEEPGDIRIQLENEWKEKGIAGIYQRLEKVDPKSAQMIHPNNYKRVIRALEYYYIHEQPISLHNEEQREKESPYEFAYFVLNNDREVLYQQINKRVDLMIANGLVEEVMKLREMGLTKANVSMQGLGYKEILDYLNGECTLEEAIYRIKRDTRHFAKRQLTWFRRERDVCWIDKSEYENDEVILNKIEQELKDRGVI